MKHINKLVRDKVLLFIEKDGHKYKSKVLNQKEYKIELLNALIEEASEVKLATDKLELTVELADVYEVLDAIKLAFDINPGDLTRAQTRKRKERGGFDNRIFLETIDDQ